MKTNPAFIAASQTSRSPQGNMKRKELSNTFTQYHLLLTNLLFLGSGKNFLFPLKRHKISTLQTVGGGNLPFKGLQHYVKVGCQQQIIGFQGLIHSFLDYRILETQ